MRLTPGRRQREAIVCAAIVVALGGCAGGGEPGARANLEAHRAEATAELASLWSAAKTQPAVAAAESFGSFDGCDDTGNNTRYIASMWTYGPHPLGTALAMSALRPWLTANGWTEATSVMPGRSVARKGEMTLTVRPDTPGSRTLITIESACASLSTQEVADLPVVDGTAPSGPGLPPAMKKSSRTPQPAGGATLDLSTQSADPWPGSATPSP